MEVAEQRPMNNNYATIVSDVVTLGYKTFSLQVIKTLMYSLFQMVMCIHWHASEIGVRFWNLSQENVPQTTNVIFCKLLYEGRGGGDILGENESV